jgi:hypothetical protein
MSNAHISVTSGVFNNLTTGFSPTFQWPSFTNIVTQEVPEPTSIALFGASLAVVCAARRRWKRT